MSRNNKHNNVGPNTFPSASKHGRTILCLCALGLTTAFYLKTVTSSLQLPQHSSTSTSSSSVGVSLAASCSRLECLQTIQDLPIFQQQQGQEHQDLPQVYIVMAAKAGGSSLKDFAVDCAAEQSSSSSSSRQQQQQQQHVHADNFLNDAQEFQAFLLNTLHVPKVVVSHIYSDQPLIQLLRHASYTNSLVIYVYRDETDRLSSAIRHDVKHRLCAVTNDTDSGEGKFHLVKKRVFGIDKEQLQYNNTCTFDEAPFVEHLIRSGSYEVGISILATLTCSLWSEIDESAPANLLFVHYSQVSPLQQSLSNLYCPNVPPKMSNTKSNPSVVGDVDGRMQYRIRTSSRDIVTLEDWLQAKKNTLEFALQLPSSRGGCQHKIRSIQDKLQQQQNKHQIPDAHQQESCPLVRILPKKWE